MRYKIIYTLLFITISFRAYSQQKVTLSGTITIKVNTETITGASVFIPEAKVSAVTNAYGFYSITLPKGEYTIVISCIGFENIEEHLSDRKQQEKFFDARENQNFG